MSLRQHGYDTHGVDVAVPPVEMLRKAGLQVAHGSLDSVPESWPFPKVVSCFEVLEHVPDPVGFLASIRKRFPDTPLVLSVPLPVDERCHEIGGFCHAADYPPNHLTRWTSESLRIAFEKAGYRPSIHKVHVTGDEIPNGLRLGLGIGRLISSLGGQNSESHAAQGAANEEQKATEGKSNNGLSEDNMSQHAFYRSLQRYTLFPYVMWLRIRGKSGYSFLVIGE
jgi:hypothetical protein